VVTAAYTNIFTPPGAGQTGGNQLVTLGTGIINSDDLRNPAGSDPQAGDFEIDGPESPSFTASETGGPLGYSGVRCEADTDDDRVCDDQEDGNPPTPGRSSRYLPDSDGDGLTDGIEDVNRNGIHDAGETLTRVRDTDADGWGDGVEVLLAETDPVDAGDPGTAPVDADSDGLPANLDPDEGVNDLDADRYTDGYEAVQLDLAAVSDAASNPPLGDVDQNAVLDNADSQLILNFFGRQPLPPDFTPMRADVNRDAFIDNSDSQISLNFFARVQPVFPSN
jgi:hypothetical protein